MNFAASMEWLSAGLQSGLARAQAYLPSVGLALALVAVGWAVGALLRRWVVRLLDLFERRFQKQTHRFVPVGSDVERRASEVIGSFVFWAVFVIFLAAATDTLGLPVLSTWLSGLSQFLPRLLLATLILLAGVLAGRLARDAISAAVTTGGLAFGQALGRSAQIAIVVAAAVTAVDQIGIDSGFLTSALLITIGALLGGTALAFGFGARTSAANVIALHYVRQRYHVGQTIRVGEVEGTIVEISATEVVVDAGDAYVQVPGQHFARQAAAVVKTDS